MTAAVEYAKMYHRRRLARERQFSDLLKSQLECSPMNKMVDTRSSKRRARLSKGANLFEAYKRSSTFFGNTIPRPGGNLGMLGSPDISACNLESLSASLFDYHAVQRALSSGYTLDSSKNVIDVFSSDELHNINDEEVFIPNVNSTTHKMTIKNKSTRSKQCAASGYGQHRENSTFRSQGIALWSTCCSSLKNGKEKVKENNNMIYCQGCHRNLKRWSHVKSVMNSIPKGSTSVTPKSTSRSSEKEHHQPDQSIIRNVSELSATATSHTKCSGGTRESCKRISSPGKTMTKSCLKPHPVRRSPGRAASSILSEGSNNQVYQVDLPDIKDVQIPEKKMTENVGIKIKKDHRKSGWYGATESLICLDQNIDSKENVPVKQAALDKNTIIKSSYNDEKSVNSQSESSNLNSPCDKIKDAVLQSVNKVNKKLKGHNKRPIKSVEENDKMIYCQGCHRNLKQWSHLKSAINPTPKSTSRSSKKEHHQSDNSITRNVSELSVTATSRTKSSGGTVESCERINSPEKTMTKLCLKPHPVRRSPGKAASSTFSEGSNDQAHQVNLPDIKDVQISEKKMAENVGIKIKKDHRKSGWYGATESLICLDQNLDSKENVSVKQAAIDKNTIIKSSYDDEKSVNLQREISNLNSPCVKIKDAVLQSVNKVNGNLKKGLNKQPVKSGPSQNFHNFPWKPTLNMTDVQDKEKPERLITSDTGMGIDTVKDVLNLEKQKIANDFTINKIANSDTNFQTKSSNGSDVMIHEFHNILKTFNGANASSKVTKQNLPTIYVESNQLAPTEVKDSQTLVRVNNKDTVNKEITVKEKGEIVITEKMDQIKTSSNDYESNEVGQIENKNNVPKGNNFRLANYKMPITGNIKVTANVIHQVKPTNKDKTHFPQKQTAQKKVKLKPAMNKETQREVARPKSKNKSKIQLQFTAPNRKETIMKKSPVVLKNPMSKLNKKEVRRPAKIATNLVPNRFIKKERNDKKTSELPKPEIFKNKLNERDVTTTVLKSHRKIKQIKELKPTSINTEIQDVEHPTKRFQSLMPRNFAKKIDNPIKAIKLMSSDKDKVENHFTIMPSQVPRKPAKKMDNPIKVFKSTSPDKVENTTKKFQSQVPKSLVKKIEKPIELIKSTRLDKGKVENTTKMFQSQVPMNLTNEMDKPIDVFESTSPVKDKKEIKKSTDVLQSAVLNTTNKKKENSSKISKIPVPEKHDREVDIPSKLMELSKSNENKFNTIHSNGLLKEEKNEEGQQFFLRKSRLDDVVQSIKRTDILQSGQAHNNSITPETVKIEIPNLVQNQMETPCFGTTASKIMSGVRCNPFTKENTQTEEKDLHSVFGGTFVPSTGNPKTAVKSCLKVIADETLAPSKMADNKSEEAETKSVNDVSFHSTIKEHTKFKENLSSSIPLFGSFAALRTQGSGEGNVGANNNCTNYAQDQFKSKSFETYRDRRESDDD